MKNSEVTTVFKSFGTKVKDIDEAKGIVTIYINAFSNEDTDGDISEPGSFKRTFKNNISRIKHFLNHDSYKLIGVPIKLYEDQIGAIAVSQLNIKKELGRDVFEDYKLYAEHGKSLEHSVRVYAVKRDTNDTRRVLEWKLWEYSTLYGWGANEETPLINIKSLDELEMMMREGNYTDERAKQIEKLYDQLKNLIADPSGTPETDPPAPDNKDKSLIQTFYNHISVK